MLCPMLEGIFYCEGVETFGGVAIYFGRREALVETAFFNGVEEVSRGVSLVLESLGTRGH